MWMQVSSQPQSIPHTTVPCTALPLSLLALPSFIVSEFVATDLGSKMSGSNFGAKRFSLIVRVGGMCMAQSWASDESRGPGCLESLSPLPGLWSLQETSPPTPGPSKPQPKPLQQS